MRLQPGEALGPYVIQGLLGAGGMGEVYRATDRRLGRDVALKILSTETADAERLARFEREARATAMLAHPNIVTIFDVGADQGHPYLVTELLEGRTLRERLQVERRLDLPTALTLAVQLTRAIAAAHALRIVHRDLKPENLFITKSGALKVLDFGLAKLQLDAIDASTAVTVGGSHAGQLVGTPAYMAPEQLRGEPVDGRADIFAIGTIVWEGLTGTNPFRRETPVDTFAAILREPVGARPTASDVELPSTVRQLLTRCMEKDPADRFQSAEDLRFALELLHSDKGPRTIGITNGAGAEPRSIAVLPFADMSPARDQDYLCEGIADEVIGALTHIEGLRVAARTSSFQFRASGADVRAIGARLGVDSVLEGSVRKLGDRLRVTVQLVDVRDGFHRWTERYDQRVEDVFAIEDAIAQNVATALRGILTPREREAIRRPEGAVECYEFFLRARRLMYQFDRASLVTAKGLLERAIEIDPNYAPAHAAVAEIHGWFYEWWGGTAVDYETADAASLKALQLSPQLAEAHASRGFVLSIGGRYEEATREFQEALRLNPNLFEASYLYGRTAFAAGQTERAADLFLQAAAVQHEDFQACMLAGQALSKLGRHEEARRANREGIARAERQLDLNPGDARALSLGATTLAMEGRTEQGLRWSTRALELCPDDQGVLINGACLRARLGLKEEAIALLERTFAKGFGKRDWIEQDPDYDSLRDDPRFQALLARLR